MTTKKTSKKVYRAVVLGCGNIGALLEADPMRPKPATHAGAFMRNPQTALVALVDSDAKNLAAALQLFPKAKGYASVAQCLAEMQPDIVAIATPPATHKALIDFCGKSGVRAIICEKPLSYSASEAKAIERLVKKYGMLLVVNYQRRFFPLFVKAKAAVQTCLGKVEQVTCYYSNGVTNNGSHILDALDFLLEDPAVSVMAKVAAHNRTCPKGDVNIDALITLRSGATVALLSIDQAFWGINDIKIYGSKGEVLLSDYGYSLTETPVGTSVFGGVNQLLMHKAKKAHSKESMVNGVLNHVLACLSKKTKPKAGTAGQSIATLTVLDALLKSAQTKKSVNL